MKIFSQTITIDLMHDLAEIAIDQLKQLGLPTSENLDPVTSLKYFFKLMHKRIIANPRQVFYAKEFSCQTSNLIGFNLLESKIKNGSDVNSHLSKGSEKADTSDYLLNDWGIYHFQFFRMFACDHPASRIYTGLRPDLRRPTNLTKPTIAGDKPLAFDVRSENGIPSGLPDAAIANIRKN